MDIYKNKSRWKWLLAIMGILIVLFTMLYSQHLAENLRARELEAIKISTEAVYSANDGKEEDITFELFILENVTKIPFITANEEGILTGYNYEEEAVTDQNFLEKRKAAILKSGTQPIESIGYAALIYPDRSKLYRRISLFPLAQILLLSTFVLFGYYVFSTSRKSEQNRVWAGMAKETAHQLGTPISAILGWIEHLKETAENNPEQQELITELRSDVTRLELIADRFSKIGSKPELDKINLLEELHDCKEYMQRRAPARVKFDFPDMSSPPIHVSINSHLFDWVIENLLRNALDAMESSGKITVTTKRENDKAIIDISDTGKGIPSNKFKQVFSPGFTTKKRGWGLGLSLAKRIIEEYHNGKIFVKHSKPNEGTTFTIHLPLA